MDQPNLPHHVVQRVERRWAAILSQQAALRPEEKLPVRTRPRRMPGGVRTSANSCLSALRQR